MENCDFFSLDKYAYAFIWKNDCICICNAIKIKCSRIVEEMEFFPQKNPYYNCYSENNKNCTNLKKVNLDTTLY